MIVVGFPQGQALLLAPGNVMFLHALPRIAAQLFDLSFQFLDLILLLFDSIEHGPDNRIVVDH